MDQSELEMCEEGRLYASTVVRKEHMELTNPVTCSNSDLPAYRSQLEDERMAIPLCNRQASTANPQPDQQPVANAAPDEQPPVIRAPNLLQQIPYSYKFVYLCFGISGVLAVLAIIAELVAVLVFKDVLCSNDYAVTMINGLANNWKVASITLLPGLITISIRRFNLFIAAHNGHQLAWSAPSLLIGYLVSILMPYNVELPCQE